MQNELKRSNIIVILLIRIIGYHFRKNIRSQLYGPGFIHTDIFIHYYISFIRHAHFDTYSLFS